MPMRLLLSVATIAPALAGAASDGIAPQCRSFLRDMEAEGHSHFEVGALCRTRLQPEVCQRAMEPLGKRPWSPEMLEATCKAWDSEFQARTQGMSPLRRAQTKGSLLQALDTATKMKSEVGLCKNITLDKCAAVKAKEYPKKTQKIMDLMAKVHDSIMSGKPLYKTAAAAAPPAAAAAPAAAYEDRAPVEPRLLAAKPVGIFVASGLLGGALVAGAALLAQRRQRREGAVPLVVE